MRFILPLGILVVLCGGCVSEVPADVVADKGSSLSQAQRRARSDVIRATLSGEGLDNAALLFAGLANAETTMAHCWSEARWACKGPASSSCGGGPVIAGAGDGPCSLRQGGLGMF